MVKSKGSQRRFPIPCHCRSWYPGRKLKWERAITSQILPRHRPNTVTRKYNLASVENYWAYCSTLGTLDVLNDVMKSRLTIGSLECVCNNGCCTISIFVISQRRDGENCRCSIVWVRLHLSRFFLCVRRRVVGASSAAQGHKTLEHTTAEGLLLLTTLGSFHLRLPSSMERALLDKCLN